MRSVAGGMGEVYRAKDTRLDREVAVKVLPEQFATEPTALARFEREAKAIAALSHPNILAIHDVGTEEGTSFVVSLCPSTQTCPLHARRRCEQTIRATASSVSEENPGTTTTPWRLPVAPPTRRRTPATR